MMKNLFEAATVDEVKARMAKLRPDSERLRASIERFAAGGPGVCTTHPHFFFGRLTPMEWSVLMYQHLDHHLRQFQV
jgi:hypothetical protein